MKTLSLYCRLRRAFQILRRDGLLALKSRVFGPEYASDYQKWIALYDTPNADDLRHIHERIRNLPHPALISVIMATHNTPARWLKEAIESVRKQSYPHWELCIADDASLQPQVRHILEEYRNLDERRIKLTFRSEAGHISAAMNSALELATGEYAVFLDHDDELSQHALYLIAEEIAAYPEAELIYTDEDKIRDGGRRFHPNFKPDWNPELLLSQNYICHLCALRLGLIREAGGFRSGFEGAQDWDLILRASERLTPQQIRHIPQIAYHWRVSDRSTAGSVSFKPYVFSAQSAAVREHLKRRNIQDAQVEIMEDPARIRVHFPLPPEPPLVSLAIAVPGKLNALKRSLKALLDKTSYPAFEVLLVDHGQFDQEGQHYLRLLEKDARIRVLRRTSRMPAPACCNLAAAQARGAILAFFESTLEVINRDWLSELVSYALRPEVGAAGAKIIYSNNLLQHAGLILGTGILAAPAHKRLSRHHPGYFDRAALPQNLSAVSGACLVTRKEVFEQAGGFDALNLAEAFSDIDFCLKVQQFGCSVIYNPFAQLYCFASESGHYDYFPGRAAGLKNEIAFLRSRWGNRLLEDPCYSPNLNCTAADFRLAFPPRALKPWRIPMKKIQKIPENSLIDRARYRSR